jgi:hypothetical protein
MAECACLVEYRDAIARNIEAKKGYAMVKGLHLSEVGIEPMEKMLAEALERKHAPWCPKLHNA